MESRSVTESATEICVLKAMSGALLSRNHFRSPFRESFLRVPQGDGLVAILEQVVQLPEHLRQVSAIDFVDQENELFVRGIRSSRGESLNWTRLQRESRRTSGSIPFDKVLVR